MIGQILPLQRGEDRRGGKEEDDLFLHPFFSSPSWGKMDEEGNF